MLRTIGIALSLLGLGSYLYFALGETRPFEARTLVYPLAFISALATYFLRPRASVTWIAFGLNVLALASGLIVVTGMARYTVHDVASLMPVLIGIVLFVLPAGFNLVNLFKANM
jgi:hypothetical protein